MRSKSTLTQSPSAAASSMPYDVLREIFSHCLSQFPLDEIQPNAKSAPMLLCHVCSSWRVVALEIQPLWSNLHYRLPIRWENGQPIVWNSEVFLRDMEFLKWWRENQGSAAPCVRFQFYQQENSSGYEELPLTENDTKFFVEYLSSARHLDVGQFYVYLFQQNGASSSQVESLQIRSLVTRYPNYTYPEDFYLNLSDDESDEYHGSDHSDEANTYSKPDYEEDGGLNFGDEEYDASKRSLGADDDKESILVGEENVPILSDKDIEAADLNEEDESPNSDDSDKEDYKKRTPFLVPFHIPPTLRRLCIHSVEFKLPEANLNAFTSWSRLTHLSLYRMFMLPDVWYSLIRGLQNLQWGYFDIFLEPVEDNPEPSVFTLPFLSTLSVTLDGSESNIEDDPVGQFFKNLQLPSLHDLSIYVDVDPGQLPDFATEINNVLRCAPMIAKLTLGLQFLGFFDWGGTPTKWEDVEKVSVVAPHLMTLLLDMCYVDPDFDSTKSMLSKRLPYWKTFLRPSCWLDLASPANTIRRITAIVKRPSRDGPLVETHIRSALELDGVHSGGTKGLLFEIVEEDKRALSPNGVGWRTWGSNPH